jgi:microcystin-dependent protein
MKYHKLILAFVLLSGIINAQVGVNILNPHPTAALHIETPSGSLKGLLTPSMTTANRLSIATGTTVPADGLVVYDKDHHMHYYYNAAQNKWVSMAPLTLSTPATSGNSFPSGAITTPSSTATFSLGINKQNPSQVLDIVGNSTVSGNSAIGGSLTVFGFPDNALVPAGIIVMFHGSVIPAGWALCNGSQNTPDLRGRFIVSSGQSTITPIANDQNPIYSLNTTGGQNLHTLSKAEMPKHSHETNADGSTISATGGNHFHYVTPNGQVQGISRPGGGNSGGLAGDGSGTIATTTESHTHTTANFSGKVGDGTSDGLNGSAQENRPQFYVLAFIMKLP